MEKCNCCEHAHPRRPVNEETIKKRIEEMNEEQHAQKEGMGGLLECTRWSFYNVTMHHISKEYTAYGAAFWDWQVYKRWRLQ